MMGVAKYKEMLFYVLCTVLPWKILCLRMVIVQIHFVLVMQPNLKICVPWVALEEEANVLLQRS